MTDSTSTSTAPPPLPNAPARRRGLLGLLVLAGIAGLLLLFSFDPVQAKFFPKCYFHQWTGLHCPGCGTTRALHCLSHGRVDLALRYNAFTVLALPGLAWSFVRFAREAWRGGPRSDRAPLGPFIRWGIVFGVLAFAILRNVPHEPFTWLAPPAVTDKAVLESNIKP